MILTVFPKTFLTKSCKCPLQKGAKKVTEVEGEKALCLPNVGKLMLSNYTCKIPLGNIVVINSYRRNSPRTSNTTTRQSAEIKLAANLKKEQRGTDY